MKASESTTSGAHVPSGDTVCDVLVAGGGPAGSSVSAMLRKLGRSVVLLEREPHPRFHIGESLLPFTMGLLARLDFLPTLDAAGFVPKLGAAFMLADGGMANTFYFREGLTPGRAGAYQVLRSRFDHLMLQHSRGLGTDVREGHTLRDVSFEADGLRAAVDDPRGRRYGVRARFFADATGRDAFLPHKLKLKEADPALKKVALFAHFADAARDEGVDAGNTISIVIRGGWMWFIPLEGGITSIGVVVDADQFKRSGMDGERYFEHVLDRVPVIERRLVGATRRSPVHATSDFSYSTRRLFGERHLVLGDAGFFLDPVFSSGVHLAIASGVAGAEAIHAWLGRARGSAQPLRRYQREMARSHRLYERFIHGWYRPGFLELFLSPTTKFQMVQAVTSALAGSASTDWGVRLRMRLFFLLAWLNRYLPLAPRIDRAQLPP